MKMLRPAICIGIAAALALPLANTAVAEENVNAVELLSQATGLSTRQVTMVLGARTAFPEYRTSFDRVHRRFQNAIGAGMHQHLTQNRELTAQHVQDLTTMVQSRGADEAGE